VNCDLFEFYTRTLVKKLMYSAKTETNLVVVGQDSAVLRHCQRKIYAFKDELEPVCGRLRLLRRDGRHFMNGNACWVS
jgi:hypothetical protein